MAGDSNKTNLIVNYLPIDIRKKEFKEMCEKIGPINSFKLMRDIMTGLNLGYGFVSYKKAEDAEKAISELNGRLIGNKNIKVTFAEHEPVKVGINLFVSNIPNTYNVKDVEKLFNGFGEISRVRLITNYMKEGEKAENKAFAYVRLSEAEQAERAINELNGSLVPGLDGPLSIQFPTMNARKLNQSISEYLKNKPARLETNGKIMFNKGLNRFAPYSPLSVTKSILSGPNPYGQLTNPTNRSNDYEIYIRGLVENTTEQNLWELFGPYGAITSVYVAKDALSGNCKGFGFINMANYDDANRAIMALNGSVYGSRVLHVAFKSNKSFTNANDSYDVKSMTQTPMNISTTPMNMSSTPMNMSSTPMNMPSTPLNMSPIILNVPSKYPYQSLPKVQSMIY